MTTQNAPTRPWKSALTGLAIASCVVLVPALATAMADVATNPIAQPNIQLSTTLTLAQPGTQNYVLTMGKTVKQVTAKTIRIARRADGTVSGLFVDGVKLNAIGTVAVSIATGSGSSSNSGAQYSSSTTITPLPGGGTRTDTTNGDGSSTTTIHDPAGGKNGGSRTTTSSTDSEGNTTTTTTTEDGSDGSTTTTITTSP
jgi:hypothetical protein